ncbi:hypothetical protein QFZ67_000480 [Streptomyces sp. V1I1]|nr:hypothetical protein [Streptomyces sp. V1I1]
MATGATALLSLDPELATTNASLEQLVRDAYGKRNAEIHGDHQPDPGTLHLPKDTPGGSSNSAPASGHGPRDRCLGATGRPAPQPGGN